MSQMEQSHSHDHATDNVFLNRASQVLIFFGLLSVVLFTLLLTTYAPVHDFFHGIRHALMIVPCH
ncbi:MAG: CbtB-domain containing protein [bacterium]